MGKPILHCILLEGSASRSPDSRGDGHVAFPWASAPDSRVAKGPGALGALPRPRLSGGAGEAKHREELEGRASASKEPVSPSKSSRSARSTEPVGEAKSAHSVASGVSGGAARVFTDRFRFPQLMQRQNKAPDLQARSLDQQRPPAGPLGRSAWRASLTESAQPGPSDLASWLVLASQPSPCTRPWPGPGRARAEPGPSPGRVGQGSGQALGWARGLAGEQPAKRLRRLRRSGRDRRRGNSAPRRGRRTSSSLAPSCARTCSHCPPVPAPSDPDELGTLTTLCMERSHKVTLVLRLDAICRRTRSRLC